MKNNFLLKKITQIFLSIFVVSSSLLATINPQKGVEAIVTAQWLKTQLNNPSVVVVDLREPVDFAQNHIENAVNIPFKKLFGADQKMIPSLSDIRELFGAAGIDSKTHVIGYDSGVFKASARLYWLLETMGHRKVSILNVGYGNWENGVLPTTSEIKQPKKKEFVPAVDNEKMQTKLGTLVSIGQKTIIDGRKTSHYLGQESKAKRFGHIPTAKNYACTNNFEVTKTGNKMRDLKELSTMYKDIPKDKDIILYCDGGAESALNYIVLQELGYKAAVYAGSWNEWGNDMMVPVENPSLTK